MLLFWSKSNKLSQAAADVAAGLHYCSQGQQRQQQKKQHSSTRKDKAANNQQPTEILVRGGIRWNEIFNTEKRIVQKLMQGKFKYF